MSLSKCCFDQIEAIAKAAEEDEEKPLGKPNCEGPKIILNPPVVSISQENMVQINELCKKLNCPQMSFQMEKLTAAQDQLSRIQNRELFDRIFGSDYLCFKTSNLNAICKQDNKRKFVYYSEFDEQMGEEEEMICLGSAGEAMDLLPENEWHGFFKGYKILTDSNEFNLNDLKKCIEIGYQDTENMLEAYLRAGVRCFMIDLFKGNIHSNQTLVVRFRQSEYNVAKELGFPVTSTLFARISPRLQYTGYLNAAQEAITLKSNEFLTLTTDRYWASRCTKRRIFVNARYLLIDTQRCDILLIGTEIQLQVQRVLDDALRCKVIHGGILRSRMPVLFNKRCQRFRISLCELEDISFVKEVGINVIVSDMIGTPAYFKNLRESLTLLDCSNLRVFARLIINNIVDEDDDISWAKDAYDGFLGELSKFRDGCGGDGNVDNLEDADSTRILFLSTGVRQLIESAHRARKPFIFDPTPLIEDEYVMDPASYKHVLYHPDKYLFRSEYADKITVFHMVANVLAKPMPQAELSQLLPYCDESHTGSDSLALATAATSFEIDASCIFVLGVTGRMATKISCFRPKATIYFISGLKSVTNYISIHHNVVMLYFHQQEFSTNYRKSVYRELLFGLSYAVALRALKHGDNVLFVYGQNAGQLFPDKYIAYKFDAKNFVHDLPRLLF